MKVPGHFTSRKEPQYPMNSTLGGQKNWFGHFSEEKNLLSLHGVVPWTIQLIA